MSVTQRMMDVFDLLIRNGTIVSSAGELAADIAVKNGSIAASLAPGMPVAAVRTYDASGCYLLPGAVDAHVHCGGPARSDRETWASATMAAARGGVTTIIEMPMSNPPASSPEVLRNRVKTGEEEVYVDFALYAGGATSSAREAAQLAAEGIIGYKVMAHAAPVGRENEFVGLCAPSNALLYDSLKATAQTGLPCAIHAEDESLLSQGVLRTQATGSGKAIEHARSRPPYVEAVSIATLLTLAYETGSRLHLPHVSSAWGLGLGRIGKRQGVDVSIETCPHYLCFDEDALERFGGFAKINPPLRMAKDRESLWEGIRDGVVDNVASDHCAYLVEEKDRTSIWDVRSGHPGLEALSAVVYDAALQGRISMTQAVAVLAEGPARRFGLRKKGRLAPGCDADIAILDPTQRWTFDWHDAYSLARRNYTMYQGCEYAGKFKAVLSRGEVVYDGNAVVGKSGHGRYVTPET